MRIEVECCEGSPRYKDQCLKDKCPIYSEAKADVQSGWPYVGTGFGNLYGNPSEAHYLSKVRENLQAEIAKANTDVVEPSPTPKGQE